MHIKRILLLVFLNFCATKAAIIAWSNKKLEISPLLPFDDEDLENLVNKLDVHKVFRFKVALRSSNALIPRNLKEVINPFYSAYNANGNIGTLNSVGYWVSIVVTIPEVMASLGFGCLEIMSRRSKRILEIARSLQDMEELSLSEDCNGIDTNKVLKTTGHLSNSTDFLCVLDITYPRIKRDLLESITEEERPQKDLEPKGPIIYIGQTKKNDQYALLYSSKPLKLEINNNTKYLGNTDNSLITVDKRFNIPIPLEEKGKVILRFGISWVSGYWYLQTTKVELIGESNDSSNYDLSTDENIMAPAHFSYHCNGQSIFFDPSSGTKLTIYDLQVQIDAKKQRFGDANDCVPFTTAPIWSGLFVTTILGLGLIVALTAILDIKTMDKFDNNSTKNLGITVME